MSRTDGISSKFLENGSVIYDQSGSIGSDQIQLVDRVHYIDHVKGIVEPLIAKRGEY